MTNKRKRRIKTRRGENKKIKMKLISSFIFFQEFKFIGVIMFDFVVQLEIFKQETS